MAVSDVDDETHLRLLRAIGAADPLPKGSLPLTRTKEKFDLNQYISASAINRDHTVGFGALKSQQETAKKRHKVVEAPLHRQAKQRVERAVAYSAVRQEVQEWDSLVRSNRVAEQISFPLDQQPYTLGTVKETLFGNRKPRTELEIQMARVLNTSKHTFRHVDELTEAEKEVLKSMNLKEAERKSAELKRTRALISNQAQRWKRQKKIKSKQYHRLKKRAERKKVLKEFEELKNKDPEAAREKLELLEVDRIKERATLRHRGTGQWAKDLRLHAKHDPRTKDALQDQLRLGRELAEKNRSVRPDSSDDASDEDGLAVPDQNQQIEDLVNDEDLMEVKEGEFKGKDNPWMISSLKRLRRQSSNKSAAEPYDEPTNSTVDHRDFEEGSSAREEEDSAAEVEANSSVAPQSTTKTVATQKETGKSTDDNNEEKVVQKGEAIKPKKKKKDKKTKKRKRSCLESEEKDVFVDTLFDELEDRLVQTVNRQLQQSNANDQASNAAEDDSISGNTDFLSSEPLEQRAKFRPNSSTAAIAAKAKKQEKKLEKRASQKQRKLLDPTKYLKRSEETVSRNGNSNNGIERMMGDGQEGGEETEGAYNEMDLLNEAFEDDDVIAEFKADKQALIDSEKPKDIDLSLPGWGDWTGPDIEQNPKKKKRFIIKAKNPGPRKDKDLPGVIISQKEDVAIRKLQVKSVPFPFTSAEDYEASLRHPIGKEWNTELSFQSLTQRPIKTRRGTVIMPMNKEAALRKGRMNDSGLEDSGDL